MPAEYAGIPRDSVVAQQVHHAAHVAERIPQPEPEPAPVAAAAALKPDLDLSGPRAFAKALRCIVRPYPSDEVGPSMSRSRMAVVAGGAAAVVAAAIIMLRRSR